MHVILRIDFKSLDAKLVNSCLPQMLNERQNVRGRNFSGAVADSLKLEREGATSL